MRVKITKTKIYEWAEMSEDQKDKAIEKLYDINVDYEWWDSVYDDAKAIGLKIDEFDIDRGSYCKGKFIWDAISVANKIMDDHGKDCETYKTAKQYVDERNMLIEQERKQWIEDVDGEFIADDVDTSDIDDEFLRLLLEDYRIMLQNEYEYLTSRQSIIETIEANEYEFDENGNIA
jgi:hypothetical protein